MSDLYFCILEFVILAKKLEFQVAQKYNYVGESVFRGVIDRKIPYKGKIILEDVFYDFAFHGTGIDFISKNTVLRYERYGGHDGLGVYFSIQNIIEYGKGVSSLDFDNLLVMNLIQRWMPDISGSGIYYLV